VPARAVSLDLVLRLTSLEWGKLHMPPKRMSRGRHLLVRCFQPSQHICSQLTEFDQDLVSQGKCCGSICCSRAAYLGVPVYVVLQRDLTNKMSEVTSVTSELQHEQSAPLMGSNKGTGTPKRGPALGYSADQISLVPGVWGSATTGTFCRVHDRLVRNTGMGGGCSQ